MLTRYSKERSRLMIETARKFADDGVHRYAAALYKKAIKLIERNDPKTASELLHELIEIETTRGNLEDMSNHLILASVLSGQMQPRRAMRM